MGLTYLPLADLHLAAHAVYTHAYLTAPTPADAGQVVGVSGNSLPLTPLWSGSATADYSHALLGGWKGNIGAGWRFTGKRFTTIDNNGNCTGGRFQCDGFSTVPVLKAYGVIDAHIGLTSDQWALRLFARNLTNKYVYINLTQGEALPLQPRVIGFSVDRSF